MSQIKLKFIGLALLLIANYFTWQAVGVWADTSLRIFFLDVGQGDAILIRTPSHHTILVDGGPDQNVIAQLNRVMPLWNRHIDLLVLTHPQADHVTGLLDVLERFTVGEILATFEPYDSQTNSAWLSAALAGDHAINYADAADDYQFGEVRWDTLHPLSQLLDDSEDVNEHSVVAKITYAGVSLLLTGDAGFPAEARLLDTYANLDVDILKVGHHGSRYASSSEFLAATQPEVAVIQVGQNSFGHPTDETLGRLLNVGATIYRSDTEGLIEVVVTQTGYTVAPR